MHRLPHDRCGRGFETERTNLRCCGRLHWDAYQFVQKSQPFSETRRTFHSDCSHAQHGWHYESHSGAVSTKVLRRRFEEVCLLAEREHQRRLRARRQVDAGWVVAVIDSIFEWDDAVAAYRKLKGGRAKGKIIVKGPPE